MKKHLLAPFILIVVLAISCKHEPLLPGYTLSPECFSDTVYFVNDIQPFLNSNCAFSGCHDAETAEDGVDLSSYDQVISTGGIDRENPTESELYQVLIDTDPDDVMPPPEENLTISENDIDMVLRWIEQNARHNECTVPPCDTLEVSYAYDIDPILTTRCNGQSCHGTDTADGGFGLMNYPDVLLSANSGGLVGSVFHLDGWSEMPDGLPQMDSCTLNKILAWVNQGAQDN